MYKIMKKEVIVNAKTLEQAVEIGAQRLNMKKEDVAYEIIEIPKKKFFGLAGVTDYKVKITGAMSNTDTAVAFLEKIIGHMNINAVPKVISETKDEIKIEIVGENLGTLIGYHGEILDSLQYLTYLVVNKDDGGDETESETGGEKSGAVKISIDIESYRQKREETLQTLAKRMADRVLKYGKAITLEPMNAYERRIIHAAIQDINGVNTHSVGIENDRRIVISKDYGAASAFRPGGRPNFRNSNNNQNRGGRPPYNPNNPYNPNRNKFNNNRTGGGYNSYNNSNNNRTGVNSGFNSDNKDKDKDKDLNK